ncbi:hypothetical protein [Nonomuraea angiospora]
MLVRQLEYPTALVLHSGDEDDRELSRTVLAHLATFTPVHSVEALPPVAEAGYAPVNWPNA